jgi:hypothetical protein
MTELVRNHAGELGHVQLANVEQLETSVGYPHTRTIHVECMSVFGSGWCERAANESEESHEWVGQARRMVPGESR